jgi:AraC-like DNA-binding protein
MSRDLGVSRSHLSHTFSQRLGTNFRSYVNALRIDQACEMLKGTEDSVTHIAYECGFESQRTFNRVFMEQCGLSPSEYRRKYQEER